MAMRSPPLRRTELSIPSLTASSTSRTRSSSHLTAVSLCIALLPFPATVMAVPPDSVRRDAHRQRRVVRVAPSRVLAARALGLPLSRRRVAELYALRPQQVVVHGSNRPFRPRLHAVRLSRLAVDDGRDVLGSVRL